MEHPEGAKLSIAHLAPFDAVSVAASSLAGPLGPGLFPQMGGEPCPCGSPGGTCHGGGNPNGTGMTAAAYVYALGRVEPRFPSLAVEKEFAQATGRAETAGLTDRQAVHAVLSQHANRYLARQLCYVLTIEGLETYLLQPRDPADLELLVEAVRPAPRPTDVAVVIGVRGPIAPPELCNGLMIPIVVFNQLYAFESEALIRSIPRPGRVSAVRFRPTAEELFMRIRQLADNTGTTDAHRALNYLVVRYPAIYATAAERHRQDTLLTAVDVRRSHLSGVRNIVEVIFAYTHRQTGATEKFFVRVDVTEEFPFLVTRLSPYYDR
jgi:PatG Domain